MNPQLIKILCFMSVFCATSLQALIPDLGHMARHQPLMLKNNSQPFAVNGSIEIEGEKAAYNLVWAGASSGYAVEFEKLPASWLNGSDSVTLVRNQSNCVLMVGKTSFPCLPLRFWGDFEFNSSADRVNQSIQAMGIATASELVYRPIHSKDLANRKPSRVKPTLKTIQGVFLSVLEFEGPGGLFIDFDTTTYAPLAAKIPVEGMLWELSANSDFNLEKEENRNNLIISKKIEVRETGKLLATVRRDPLRRIAKGILPDTRTKGSLAQIPMERFTEKGRTFLKVLLVTH